MRRKRASMVAALGVMLGLACLGSSAKAATAFTWNGYLVDGSTPLDGQYDLRFRLYSAAVGGNKLGNDFFFRDNFPVPQGYFCDVLDFGVDIFDGQTRYVEIAFRLGNLSDPYPYRVLNAPRQEVTRTHNTILANQIAIGTDYPEGQLKVNGTLYMGDGGNIILKAAFSDDPGDIVFQTSDGSQKARIWCGHSPDQNALYFCTNPNNTADFCIDAAGTVNARGRIAWGGGGLLSPDQGAAIKLRGDGTTPYIDFANDLTSDYDMRLILAGDDLLSVAGGNLAVDGYVRAQAYYTGDIFFQKDGQKVWRMFEDAAGLYVESLTTHKKYNVMLQESGSTDSVDAATIAGLKAENESLRVESAALRQRMADFETRLTAIEK